MGTKQTTGIYSMANWRGNILSYNNAKTVKGEKSGIVTAIWYGAPNTISGYDACPNSSSGCRDVCLFSSGFGAMRRTQNARILKTKLFFENRRDFHNLLAGDISSFILFSKKNEHAAVLQIRRDN